MTTTEGGRGSVLDRALRIVGDVKPGEGAKAAVLGVTLFVLLSSYYLLKVAREILVLSSYDATVKVYVAAGQALLLIPAVAAYSWLSNRVGRFRLVVAVTVFFAVCLVLFGVAYLADLPIALPFYVWVGIFNVFVIAQLWAFANDLYTEEDGKRLFAVIGLGASLGAIAGSYAAEPVGDAVGILGLFGLALVLMLSTLLGTWKAHSDDIAAGGRKDEKKDAEKGEAPKDATKDAEPAAGRNAFALLFSDRYFLWIALLLLCLNCENTLGEYILDRVLQEDLATRLGDSPDSETVEAAIRQFKSIYFGAFNTLGFLIQLFVTGRVMKRTGSAGAILVLPVVALLGQLGAFVSGVALMAMAVAKVSENAVDYSLNGTAKNALFLVVPREAKYKVKVLLDSVVVRFGDVIAGMIVLGASTLELPTLGFLAVSSVVTVCWLGVAIALRRDHARRAASEPAPAS